MLITHPRQAGHQIYHNIAILVKLLTTYLYCNFISRSKISSFVSVTVGYPS